MTVVLYFGTMLLNFYCLLMKKKARALDIWSLIFFGMIFAGNIRDGNCDLGRYRFHYLQGTSSVESDIWHVEKGYGYLADAFSHFGIPFQLFLLVIFVVCAFLIFQLMREFECSYSVFFFLYGFFYFFFTLEVLRFFIAVSLLMLGIKFLLKNRWLRFILCVLTASLFHISFVVYFVLLFIPIRKITEKHYKTFLILMLMASGIIFLNGNRIPFYGTLYALIFGDWKTNLYVDSRTHLGWIPYLLYYLFTLAFIVIAGRLIKYAEKKNHIRYDKLRAFQNLCMKCALLLSFDLPLVMMNVDYFRVFFAASLLSFILLSAVFGECTSVRTNLRGDGVIKRETVIQNISWKNRYVMRRTGSIVLIILFWSMIWWKLKINDINLLDALKQNIFYLF